MSPDPVTWGEISIVAGLLISTVTLFFGIRRDARARDKELKDAAEARQKALLAEVEKVAQEVHSVREESDEGRRRLYAHLEANYVRKEVHEASIEGFKHALEEQTAIVTSAIGALERVGTNTREGNGK